MLSHRNLVVGAKSVASYLGNDADDTLLAALPLSFDAGFSQLTTGFAVGAHVVLLNYLLPGDVVRLCAEHRVTGLTCVPPLWHPARRARVAAEATASLRYFANTGGRMPRATLDRLRAIFPAAAPFLMYGLTEAFRSTYLARPRSTAGPTRSARRSRTPRSSSSARTGRAADPTSRASSSTAARWSRIGYWNDPEQTAERFRPLPAWADGVRDGELAVCSGDTVVADADGFLYFVGRRDEMIKTSGYRVSPTEVEEVVYATGLVGDAVALGVEHARLGQAIVLVASPPAGAELDVAALLAELQAPAAAVHGPARGRGARRLPRTPNGKIDRKRCAPSSSRRGWRHDGVRARGRGERR